MKKTLLMALAMLIGIAVQAQVTEFPYTQGFENGLDGWTTVDQDGDGYNWDFTIPIDEEETPAHSGSAAIHSASYWYDDYEGEDGSLTANNFLVSPAIVLPSGNYTLSWWTRTGLGSYPETYSVYVSTDGNTVADFMATTAVYTHTFSSSETDYAYVSVDLSDYAGQTIYIAFRHHTDDEYFMSIDDITIAEPGSPMVSVTSSLTLDAGIDANITATLVEGDVSGLTWSWTSVMEAAGQATMSNADSVLTINYTAGGTDTVTVTATNSFGSASATAVVYVRDCQAVGTFPWTEGFDDETALDCWTIIDAAGSYTWTRQTAATYVHSGTGFMGSASYYSGSITPDDYLISPAINLPDDGTYVLEYYVAASNSSFYAEHVSVYVVNSTDATEISAATPVEAYTLTAADYYANGWTKHTVSLDSLAGQTVRVAFRHHGCTGQDWLMLDDVTVRMSGAPMAHIDGATSANIGFGQQFAAVLEDGDPDDVTYSWSSTMVAAGLATMTAADSIVTITYTTTGTDTVTLVVTGSLGADTNTMVVNVVDMSPVAEYPYSTGFENAEENGRWMLIGSATDNAWAIGNATGNGDSTALYVSADGGATYGYDNSNESYSYAYRVVNLETGDYVISYDWRCMGEPSTYSVAYDYMRVLLAPASFDPQGSTGVSGLGATTVPTGFVSLDGDTALVGQDTWQSEAHVFSISNSGIYKLVFYWYNDGSVSSGVPGAVDNIMLMPLSCSAPTALTIDNVTTDSIAFHWTPAGEESSWQVMVGNQTQEVTDTFFVAEGLEAATVYTVRVRAICGEGDSSIFTSTNVRTECGDIAIPYAEGFENGGEQCWAITSYNTSSASYTGVATSTTYATSGTKVLRMYPGYTYQPTFAVLPRMDNISSLMMTFNACGSTYNNMQVGTMASPADTASFVPVYTTNMNGLTMADYEVFFDAAPDTHHYIAIRVGVNSSYGYYTYIDDVQVSVATDCRRPSSIGFVEIGETAAELAIVDAMHTGSYHVVVLSGADTVMNQTVNDTTVSLTGLTASTQYTVKVSSICTDDAETNVITTSFRTECSPISIPYTEDFEGSGHQCWYITSYYPSYASYNAPSSSYSASGSYSLRLYPGYNYQPVFAAMPRMDSIGSLMMTFQLCGSSYGTLQVGTMASPYDTASFTPLYSVMSGISYTMTDHELFFDAAPADHHYIAFRAGQNNYSGYSVYIDDVAVAVASSCHRPSALGIDDITQTSAQLTITDPTNVGSYHVVVVHGTDTVADATVSTTTYGITGLTASTVYTVTVSALCGDGAETSTISTTFRTECGESVYPFSEDFSDASAIDCWTVLNLDGNTYHWNVSSGEAHTSFNSSTNANDWLITPAIAIPADATTANLEWDVRGSNYQTYQTHLTVYLSTTAGTDPTDFTDTLSADTLATTMTHFTASLSAYAGQTIRIAFVHDSYNDNGPYLDNVEINGNGTPGPGPQPQPETCNVPTNLHSVSATETAITLDWTPGGNESQWQLQVDGGQPVTVNSHPYTLSNLTAGTTYSAKVRAVCSEGNYSDWSAAANVSTSSVDTTGIASVNDIDVVLSPNPASTVVSVSAEGLRSVEVADVAGRVVLKQEGLDGIATLSVERLARGVYFVRLRGEGYTAVRKLVVSE